MRIGLISDTHDNLVALDRALAALEAAGVEAVIHAGDFCSPFALKLLLGRLRVPLLGVFGNNDGERRGLARLLPDLCDGPRRFDLGGRRFCLVHDAATWRRRARRGPTLLSAATRTSRWPNVAAARRTSIPASAAGG